MMRKFLCVFGLSAALCVLFGCGAADTSVSRDPSKADLQKNAEERMAAIDKLTVSPQVKEQMKKHLQSGMDATSKVGPRQ